MKQLLIQIGVNQRKIHIEFEKEQMKMAYDKNTSTNYLYFITYDKKNNSFVLNKNLFCKKITMDI